MSLVFATAAPGRRPDPRRADVALIVGFVALRSSASGTPAGPVAVDSFSHFDTLFAWNDRPVLEGSPLRAATYVGAAVRSFFARGGRRAVVVSVGTPWPLVETATAREAGREARLALLLPEAAAAPDVPRTFVPHEPSRWQGVHHLAGESEASLLLLPDLPEICSSVGPPPSAELPLPAVPTTFVECSENEAPPPDDTLARMPAPRLDAAGYLTWERAVRAVRTFLARPAHREALLLAALPLPQLDARSTGSGRPVHAQDDIGEYLRRQGVLPSVTRPADIDPGVQSAFVQLAWPWLATRDAADLAQGLEPPDGVLAGLLAAGATQQGCFRSVAGDFSMPRLRDIGSALPEARWSAEPGSPDALLAKNVCVFAPQPGGWALQSDVTLSSQEAWRFGGASRLMGTLLRAARIAGAGLVFDPNGPAAWSQVRRAMERLLDGFWRAGALGGADASQAYYVRCDRSTMSQADLDNGRLIAEITVRPAASVERITVVLDLNSAAAAQLRQAA
jgi:hypothetical protein